ncbi:MAG TPA: hypothetical protein VI455_07420 [Terriglobia bacterium]
MATAAQVLPGARRRARQTLAAGRAPVREVYFVKRIDNSRIVREVDGAKHRECYTLAGLIGLAFILCFAYAWQHFQCVRYGYEIEQLRQKQSSLENWNRRLKSEQQSLDKKEFIEGKAQAELGLEPAQPGQVVRADQFMGTPPIPDEPQLAESRPAPSAALAALRRTR